MAEGRLWRARALAMGLPPDTPPEEILLVSPVIDEQGRQIGIEPAKAIRDEYERTRRWVAEEA